MPKTKQSKKNKTKKDSLLKKKVYETIEYGDRLVRNCEKCHSKKLDSFNATRCIFCFLVDKKDVHNCDHVSKGLLAESECESFNLNEDEDEDDEDEDEDEDILSKAKNTKKKPFEVHLNDNVIMDLDSLFR